MREMMRSRDIEQSSMDMRVKVTVAIWGFATVMMVAALAMPKGFVPLPMFIIGGAWLSTRALWGEKEGENGNPGFEADAQLSATRRELAETQRRLLELEERLESVETISRFETGLASRSVEVSASRTPAVTPLAGE